VNPHQTNIITEAHYTVHRPLSTVHGYDQPPPPHHFIGVLRYESPVTAAPTGVALEQPLNDFVGIFALLENLEKRLGHSLDERSVQFHGAKI
jgi:hypothetical protein